MRKRINVLNFRLPLPARDYVFLRFVISKVRLVFLSLFKTHTPNRIQVQGGHVRIFLARVICDVDNRSFAPLPPFVC